MTDPTGVPGGRFNLGRVFERMVGVTRRNFAAFAVLSLLLTALPEALAALKPTNVGDWTSSLAALSAIGGLSKIVTGCILQGALIQGVVTDLNGRRVTFADCLRVGLAHFLPVLGVSILALLAFMFGLVLFVVPGLMMAVAWAVAVPVQVMENRGVFDSFSRSAALTRGSRWGVFLLFVIYAAVLVASGGAFKAVADIADSPAGPVLIFGVLPVLNALLSLVVGVGVAAVYQELRMVKEGVGPETLAAIFD